MDDSQNQDQHGAPERDTAQDGQHVDEASGQKVGPPGQGDLDRDKLERQVDDLEQAGGGH